jgi:hypothetical protein
MFNGSMCTFVKGSKNPYSPGVIDEPRIPDPDAYSGARFQKLTIF